MSRAEAREPGTGRDRGVILTRPIRGNHPSHEAPPQRTTLRRGGALPCPPRPEAGGRRTPRRGQPTCDAGADQVSQAAGEREPRPRFSQATRVAPLPWLR